jgi:hypothetical protein
MAEQQNDYEKESLFKSLAKLFRSNIVVRKTKSGQIKVKDVDLTQTALTSNFIDRYNRLHSSSWGDKYAGRRNAANAFDILRKELFRDYELMDSDPIIASSLDIYSDESTVDNVEKSILSVNSDNPRVTKILNNLFYDIMNIEFNLWSWIRNLVKYGDFFLKLEYLHLEIEPDYGIHNVKPISTYEMTRVEDTDPENPAYVVFKQEGSYQASYENYEIAHFRMLGDSNFLPYGKSAIVSIRGDQIQLHSYHREENYCHPAF